MNEISSKHAVVDNLGDGIVQLTIAEAGSLNILGTPVLDELIAATRQLAQNADIRVLILRGTGDKGFVGGADIKEMAALNRESAQEFIELLRTFCELIRVFPVPVIVRLPGWCLGGGLELALAGDIRIAADTVKLGMPEVKVGIPSIIHAALMPRLIGHARTSWMLLTGAVIEAEECLQWGLVNKVVPLAALDAEVLAQAKNLAGFGAIVVRQQKRLLREWQTDTLEVAIGNGVREFGSAFDTGEPQAYMNEFLEQKKKRKQP